MLITNGNETAYRQEVDKLDLWYKENNLILNINKTKEMIVDFRKTGTAPPPLYINGTTVEMVKSFKYLGVYINNNLTWHDNTAHDQKGSPTPTLPKEAEKGGTGYQHPLLLLQMCSGEHTDFLHHSVVLQLHSGREAGTAEGGEGCTKNHRMQLTSPLGHLLQQIQGQSNLHLERLHPPCSWTVFPHPLRQEAAQHPGKDHQAEEQLFPGCCETAELFSTAVPWGIKTEPEATAL